MEIMKKLAQFIETYDSTFVVGNYPPTELVYFNETATKTYGINDKFALDKFDDIFNNKDHKIRDKIESGHLDNGYLFIDNVLTTKSNGETQLTDVRVGFFDKAKTEVFIEITPKNESLFDMAILQVNTSKRPEAILNIDDRLSIIHCNTPFHEVFDSNDELRHSHFQNDLVNGFLPESRQELINNILKTLETESTFSTKIKVFSATGEEKWYLFELEKRALDTSGDDKIMAYMTNIERQVELEETFEYVNQLFEALQDFTDDIVYVIDIKTMSLKHLLPDNLLNDKMKPFSKEIPNYMENMLGNKIIHPDDKEIYNNYVNENFNGNRKECIIRFSILSDDYEWYSIKGYNIYDENNKITKIIGTLVNIDEEHKVKEDNTLLNQYLSIMQETTTDILYRVDIETMTLYHFSNLESKIFINKAIPNYIQTFMEQDIIHPDDKALYIKQLEAFNNDEMLADEPIRFSIDGQDYKWYKVTGKKIFDKDGNLKETFGALVNVDNEHKIQERADTLNNYFGALELISGESFYIIDVKTKVLTQKGTVADELEIYGDVPNFPESVFDIIHPEELQNFKDYTENSFNGIPSQTQMRVLTPNGDYVWYELYSQIIRNAKGEVSEIFGKMNNIHKEKLISDDYTSLNQYFIALQELTEDRIFYIDIKNKEFNYTNSLNENITVDYKNTSLIEQFIKKGVLEKEDVKIYEQYFKHLINGTLETDSKIQITVGDRELEWYTIKTKIIKDDKGEPVEIFGKLENIQEKLDLEKKANYDKLTGVLARETFEELIINDLTNIPAGERNALVFIDIDDFKFINDNYGHSFGDFVLKKFSERVQNSIKKTDLLGRVGGDEFVVYLKDVDTSEMALERANTFIERMNRPISNGLISHKLGLSIGISITPDNGTDLGALYENADKAVYVSKKNGKNTATLYSKDMD